VEDVKRWLPVLVYAALIFHGSSTTGDDLPRWSFMAHDKVLHVLEYSLLGALLARAFGMRRRWWPVFPILAGLAFGIGDEFHQSFVPGRYGNDLGDLTADLVGSALGTGAFYGFHRLRRRVTPST
jgi:VanZ family protein